MARSDYPQEIVAMINGGINGNSFFPGADSVTDGSESPSGKPFLILGQDQDAEVNFRKSLTIGNEEYTPTWKNITN